MAKIDRAFELIHKADKYTEDFTKRLALSENDNHTKVWYHPNIDKCLKGDDIMRKLFERLSTIIEIGFAVRHIRLDQPLRDEDRHAMCDMFEK